MKGQICQCTATLNKCFTGALHTRVSNNIHGHAHHFSHLLYCNILDCIVTSTLQNEWILNEWIITEWISIILLFQYSERVVFFRKITFKKLCRVECSYFCVFNTQPCMMHRWNSTIYKHFNCSKDQLVPNMCYYSKGNNAYMLAIRECITETFFIELG